jgi:hypothetical protein
MRTIIVACVEAEQYVLKKGCSFFNTLYFAVSKTSCPPITFRLSKVETNYTLYLSHTKFNPKNIFRVKWAEQQFHKIRVKRGVLQNPPSKIKSTER